mmetsp:Transcript_37681/g.118886  ORF Transcript_37681/g.118886 Transcript_37681/m.118886 type:complete len:558 (-) Transcript_37681:2975-4648(-)
MVRVGDGPGGVAVGQADAREELGLEEILALGLGDVGDHVEPVGDVHHVARDLGGARECDVELRGAVLLLAPEGVHGLDIEGVEGASAAIGGRHDGRRRGGGGAGADDGVEDALRDIHPVERHPGLVHTAGEVAVAHVVVAVVGVLDHGGGREVQGVLDSHADVVVVPAEEALLGARGARGDGVHADVGRIAPLHVRAVQGGARDVGGVVERGVGPRLGGHALNLDLHLRGAAVADHGGAVALVELEVRLADRPVVGERGPLGEAVLVGALDARLNHPVGVLQHAPRGHLEVVQEPVHPHGRVRLHTLGHGDVARGPQAGHAAVGAEGHPRDARPELLVEQDAVHEEEGRIAVVLRRHVHPAPGEHLGLPAHEGAGGDAGLAVAANLHGEEEALLIKAELVVPGLENGLHAVGGVHVHPRLHGEGGARGALHRGEGGHVGGQPRHPGVVHRGGVDQGHVERVLGREVPRGHLRLAQRAAVHPDVVHDAGHVVEERAGGDEALHGAGVEQGVVIGRRLVVHVHSRVVAGLDVGDELPAAHRGDELGAHLGGGEVEEHPD